MTFLQLERQLIHDAVELARRDRYAHTVLGARATALSTQAIGHTGAHGEDAALSTRAIAAGARAIAAGTRAMALSTRAIGRTGARGGDASTQSRAIAA